ncbi:TlpA family protein disulfide reductase, partial [Chryseobacterium sp.]
NNILILNRLNAVQNKSLIINLLRYISFKNKNHHLIDNLQFLDKKLFKTEALDGFLLDYMENDNTLSKNDIDIMKKYIRESSLKKATEKSKGKVLSKNILNSTIKDAKLNEVAIKNILSVKNEKLILVDLWATWCVPCLKEIPNWKIAQKKYSDKIKFIRISIDNDQKKWSVFLKKDINDESNYIISNSSHPFIKYFEISSIPRFLLFNNKFEVISDDFDRPSDNNFDIKLKAILDEN